MSKINLEDLKIGNIIETHSSKLARILYIFRNCDAIRVEFESGIKDSLRLKDIKSIIKEEF